GGSIEFHYFAVRDGCFDRHAIEEPREMKIRSVLCASSYFRRPIDAPRLAANRRALRDLLCRGHVRPSSGYHRRLQRVRQAAFCQLDFESILTLWFGIAHSRFCCL